MRNFILGYFAKEEKRQPEKMNFTKGYELVFLKTP